MTNYRIAIESADMIDRMMHCDCPDILPRTRNCIHFNASIALRDLLIDRSASAAEHADAAIDPFDPPAFLYDFIRHLLLMIDDDPYSTETLTRLLLDNSLCPMHAIDYAICFDDNDPDCAAIRAIHPNHDT